MFTHFADGEVWPYSDELEWQSFSSLDVIRGGFKVLRGPFCPPY